MDLEYIIFPLNCRKAKLVAAAQVREERKVGKDLARARTAALLQQRKEEKLRILQVSY